MQNKGESLVTEIQKRKKEHIEVVLKKDIQYEKSAGFEKVEFIHVALPEMDFEEINTSVEFLGKKLNAPLIIEAMTGGFGGGEKINKALAKAAEKFGIAFGLGSQRAMLENKKDKSYFVREVAPNVPIIGNIGAVQLRKYGVKELEWLVSECELNALAIHLNPLQEVLQPKGDLDFSGVLVRIGKICKDLSVPVIVKETGAGIDRNVAIKLKDVGVTWIDVAGAGGSSWSKVEYLRGKGIKGFEEWGIPTAESIVECKGVLPVIASGGLRSGIDCAKSIALGAELSGAAYPFLKALYSKKLEETIEEWILQLKMCMFLTGSKNIEQLKKARMRIY